jgi:hypothetical protein
VEGSRFSEVAGQCLDMCRTHHLHPELGILKPRAEVTTRDRFGRLKSTFLMLVEVFS